MNVQEIPRQAYEALTYRNHIHAGRPVGVTDLPGEGETAAANVRDQIRSGGDVGKKLDIKI